MKKQLNGLEKYFQNILKDINKDISTGYPEILRCILYEDGGTIILECFTSVTCFYYVIGENGKRYKKVLVGGREILVSGYRENIHDDIVDIILNISQLRDSILPYNIKSISFDVLYSREKYVAVYIEESMLEKGSYNIELESNIIR